MRQLHLTVPLDLLDEEVVRDIQELQDRVEREKLLSFSASSKGELVSVEILQHRSHDWIRKGEFDDCFGGLPHPSGEH